MEQLQLPSVRKLSINSTDKVNKYSPFSLSSQVISESMIPDLPQGMLQQDILDFYDKLSGNLSDQSTIHVHWWTHRQNPSVCWICDVITLISKILDIAQEKYTKSPVDIMTDESSEHSSDLDSDAEIERELYDEPVSSNEPEYDVVEEQEE